MLRTLMLAGLVAVAAAYALQGGEYGTSDLLRQHARRQAMQAEILTLQRQVDSLGALKKRLQSDAVLQERIAREEFGLVRGEKELLYRFAEPRARPDSAARRRP